MKTACVKDKELTMSSLPRFLLRIARATNPPEGGAGMMSIIIRRPYAHLKEELCRAFEGQEDVKVIVDRRYGERRTSQHKDKKPFIPDKNMSDMQMPLCPQSISSLQQ